MSRDEQVAASKRAGGSGGPLPAGVGLSDSRPAPSAAKPPVNKLAVALQVREAMREHQKGKPVAFDVLGRPLDKDGWPARWSDPTYLGDGPWGA